MQLISYLSREKILVPKDIKIVGYDDTFVCKWSNPNITSIKQPIKNMVKASIESFIAFKNGENIDQTQVFPVELVARESSAL